MRHLLSLSVTLALSGMAAAGDIYCDPHGHDCTDRPTPGWVLVRSDQPRRPDDSAPPAPAPSSSKAPVGSSADAQLEQQKAHQAMQTDLAAKRAEQCKAAQDRYNKYLQYRRLYKPDPNGGEPVFLSDEEADKERTDAKLQVDQLCASP
jgi:hypothetical protein